MSSDENYKPRNPFLKHKEHKQEAAPKKPIKTIKTYKNPFESNEESQSMNPGSSFKTKDIFNGQYDSEIGHDIPMTQAEDYDRGDYTDPLSDQADNSLNVSNTKGAGRNNIFKKGASKTETTTSSNVNSKKPIGKSSNGDRSIISKQQGGQPFVTPNPFNSELFSNPMARVGLDMAQNYVGNAMDSINKNMDSWAAKAFQRPFKKYFEVETGYVLRKLGFILFPFLEFSKPVDQAISSDDFQSGEGSAQERGHSVLDTDLYIPLMAFTSYTLLTCLYLGLHSQY
jgi:hypothetical protein